MNLAPTPCSLEMPTCNNNKNKHAGKNSSPKPSSSCLYTLCGELRGQRNPAPGGGTGAAALLLQGKKAVKGLEHKS